jgi:hypothetical protein
MTMIKALAAGLAALCAAALPASVDAGSTDRDRDGMRDRWEREHRAFSPRADHDRDRLRNLAEYRAHTNPYDPDTDNDGVRDGKDRHPDGECECEKPREEEPRPCENPHEEEKPAPPKEEPRPEDPKPEQPPAGEWLGEVVSYENGVLTLDLREGGRLSGRVTEETKFACERRYSDGRVDRWECSADWLDKGSKVASARLEEGPEGKTFVEVSPLRHG